MTKPMKYHLGRIKFFSEKTTKKIHEGKVEKLQTAEVNQNNNTNNYNVPCVQQKKTILRFGN